jgi:hypothetical protein
MVIGEEGRFDLDMLENPLTPNRQIFTPVASPEMKGIIRSCMAIISIELGNANDRTSWKVIHMLCCWAALNFYYIFRNLIGGMIVCENMYESKRSNYRR